MREKTVAVDVPLEEFVRGEGGGRRFKPSQRMAEWLPTWPHYPSHSATNVVGQLCRKATGFPPDATSRGSPLVAGSMRGRGEGGGRGDAAVVSSSFAN